MTGTVAPASLNGSGAKVPAQLPPILELRGLRAAYGAIEVLHGIDLVVPPGGIFAVLGPNGAGKSTMLRVIAGLHPASAGSVVLAGREVNRARPDELARRGLCLIPEGRGVLPNLTVDENLRLITHLGVRMADIEARTYEHFPRLYERRRQLAGTLSGGEQQMLAMGRALMGAPKLLMLDEPSLGLAPLVVKEIFRTIDGLRATGVTILLVEQNARAALEVADHGYVLEMGEIALAGPASELARDARVIDTYLGAARAK
jgi:branched-chain amino acid transport system ATP-binding protein